QAQDSRSRGRESQFGVRGAAPLWVGRTQSGAAPRTPYQSVPTMTLNSLWPRNRIMAHSDLQRPVLFSILAAVVTLILKTSAWWLTGSVGLLSDAAESGVNLLAAVTAYACLWYAAQPVDRNHTYGHEKIEYFSSGLEGVLILVAAVSIAWLAVKRLLTWEPYLQDLEIGTLISGVAALINLAVAQLLLRVGRARGSIVLEADGKHLMTDVWTSVAVLAGLGLVWLTKQQWLDPVIAL